MFFRWMLRALPLVCACLLVGLAGCGGSDDGGERSARKGGVFHMNISISDVQSLDPALSYEIFGGQLLQATCARLLNYRDASGKAGTQLYPEVAAAMPEVSADGRTYTFTVRKGFRFNTGEPVTAKSFVRAFVRAAHPKMVSPGLGFMTDIVGAEAFHAGKAKTLPGVRAEGDELTIRLTEPSGTLEHRVAFTFFCAVPVDLPIDPDGVKLPPMAGPYYFTNRVPGRLIELKRNPHYGGRRPANVDEITVHVRTDLNTSFLEVRAGDVDYDAAGVPAPQNTRLARDFGINEERYFVNLLQEVDYIALNTRRGPFSDVNLRKAVNFAIDRPAVLSQLGANGGRATDQILAPNLPGFRDAQIYPLDGPDLRRARALAGETSATVSLYYPKDPTADAQVEVIRKNLEAIGLRVEPKSRPFNVLLNQIANPSTDYDMVLIGWQADFPDPWDFVNILFGPVTPSGNLNLPLLEDPALQRQMNEASRLRGQARLDAYANLDERIMRDYVPWIPLANRTQREFVSDRVGCYVAPGSFPLLDLAAVCLE